MKLLLSNVFFSDVKKNGIVHFSHNYVVSREVVIFIGGGQSLDNEKLKCLFFTKPLRTL